MSATEALRAFLHAHHTLVVATEAAGQPWCAARAQASMRIATGIRRANKENAVMRYARGLVILLAGALLAISPAAHAASLEDLVSAVVRIKTTINPDGQTVQALGREREGSGIVIDEEGLVLTIGYLMVEALSAELTTNAGRTVAATVVGYDHETGFGVLRAMRSA